MLFLPAYFAHDKAVLVNLNFSSLLDPTGGPKKSKKAKSLFNLPFTAWMERLSRRYFKPITKCDCYFSELLTIQLPVI